MKKQIKRIGRHKVQTVDVHAKEWFDRVNGNSYFSCQVTINYGLPSQKVLRIPFQYGYSNSFEWACVTELGWNKLIKDSRSHKSLWGHCQDSGIVLRSQKDIGCLKREVIAWGTES